MLKLLIFLTISINSFAFDEGQTTRVSKSGRVLKIHSHNAQESTFGRLRTLLMPLFPKRWDADESQANHERPPARVHWSFKINPDIFVPPALKLWRELTQ